MLELKIINLYEQNLLFQLVKTKNYFQKFE